jgi:osmotically-inducible protein OsmY
MIMNVASSAVRLSLAPARLAGRMAGSVLRELRGNGATDAGPAPSSARAKPAARTRYQTQDKRDAAAARAKAQPKRGAAGTRAKAQSKRPATRTRASARPKPEPKPLDDVTIARKVESTIFRDIEVDKGKVDVNVAERVVWLRGEVESQDLINELEARATGIIEVRRVENLLHVPETPAPGRTDTAALLPETEGSMARPEPPAVAVGATSEEATPPVAGRGTGNVEAGGKGDERAPAGSDGGSADSGAASSDGEESVAADRPQVAGLDQDADGDESTTPEAPAVADADQDPDADEPPITRVPEGSGSGRDSAYESIGSRQRGPNGG